MANVKINSLPSNKLQVVESITEAKQLERIDSGKIFVFDQGAYTVRLPKLSTDMAGWSCTMIRRTSTDLDMTISTYLSDGAKIKYIEFEADDSTGAGYVTNIVVEQSSTGGNQVCFLKFFTDGTAWYAHLYGEKDTGNTFTSS